MAAIVRMRLRPVQSLFRIPPNRLSDRKDEMPSPRAKSASEYVGEQVFKARKSKGWTQTDLAARLVELGDPSWRQTKIAKIEKGAVVRIPLDDVLALAAAL